MTLLSERKAKLLQLIVEHYIHTAEPVGSAFLVAHANLGLSGATMRNEMRNLEELGYLTHPHTSAGRIPTVQGYSYYIDHLMQPVTPAKKVQAAIHEQCAQHKAPRAVKAVAKYIAAEANMSVIVGIDQDAVYYTGISNLFSQPEFRTFAQTMNVTSMFDHIDERMDDIVSLLRHGEPTILLGEDNPLGNACGSVVIPYKTQGFFAIIGPQRMPYAHAVGLLTHIQTML